MVLFLKVGVFWKVIASEVGMLFERDVALCFNEFSCCDVCSFDFKGSIQTAIGRFVNLM